MILKSFELNKIKLNNHNFYLFYGDNEGLKEETIKNLFEKKYSNIFTDTKKKKYWIIWLIFLMEFLLNHFLIMKNS